MNARSAGVGQQPVERIGNLQPKNLKIFKTLRILRFYKNHNLVKSFSKNYPYSFSESQLKKFKKFENYNLIGMGGSSLGAKAIYNFLRPKIKKKFTFIDNLNS